jgi:DNA-formamidopyrimidine glycosylase
MPEGPEVKRLVDKINKKYKNKQITDIKVLNGKYLKKPIKNLDKVTYPLVIDSIKCKGKFIYWTFKKTDMVMFVTLGMTGWFIDNNNYYNNKHNNVLLKIGGDNVYFNDYRNFGNIIFCYKDNLDKKLKDLGPDILDINDNTDIFLQRIERKRSDTLIATALLDQKVACGCGNYLRAELLYLCKISPFREIGKMTNNELILLWKNLKKLGWYYYNESKAIKLNIINSVFIKNIETRYKKSGPSNYKPEEYTFMVYRQNIDPLGNKVVSKKIKDRMIHYVPKLQK